MRIETLGDGLRVAVADNPGALTLDGSRSYLVGRNPAVLIDPGPPGSDQLELLRRLVEGRTVGLVCLTHAHADHSGAAQDVAARFACEVGASADTLARLGLTGRVLADREEISIDGAPGNGDTGSGGSRLRVLATPGHTGDHLCYLWLPGRQLFTGDLVLGSGTSVILHPDGDVGAYLASLRRVSGEEPALILPGHGEPVTDPAELLREYVDHRLEREAQIEAALAALEEGERSVDAIRNRVYGPLPAGVDRAADASIRAHLRHIEIRAGLPPVEGYSSTLGDSGALDEGGEFEA